MTDHDTVLAALRGVDDPELRRDIVSLGMVHDLQVDGGRVTFRLVLTTPACPLRETIDTDVRAALAAVPGVEDVDIEWDAEVRGQGALGEGLFVAVAALLVAVGLPRQMVSFLGGYAFGFLAGTVLALAATASGCVLAFGYARLLGRLAYRMILEG